MVKKINIILFILLLSGCEYKCDNDYIISQPNCIPNVVINDSYQKWRENYIDDWHCNYCYENVSLSEEGVYVVKDICVAGTVEHRDVKILNNNTCY